MVPVFCEIYYSRPESHFKCCFFPFFFSGYTYITHATYQITILPKIVEELIRSAQFVTFHVMNDGPRLFFAIGTALFYPSDVQRELPSIITWCQKGELWPIFASIVSQHPILIHLFQPLDNIMNWKRKYLC